jgi:hypothetical protein
MNIIKDFNSINLHTEMTLKENQEETIFPEDNEIINNDTTFTEDLTINDKCRKCRRCGLTKPISEYKKKLVESKPHKNKKTTRVQNDEFMRICSDCSEIRVTRHHFLHILIANSREHSKKLKITEHSFDANTLEKLAVAQDNKCYYTGLPLTFHPNSDWQASFERIDNSKGYIADNAVLCILEMNNRAGWNKEKAHYAATHNDTINEEDLQNIITSINTYPSFKGKKCPIQEDEDSVLCNICKIWKPRDCFYTKLRYGCKECSKEKTKAREASYRGVLQILVTGSRKNCKISTRSKRGLVHTITFDDIVKMYTEQRGLCYYSGIKLTTSGDWKMSIERKNVRIGYTVENCCIIAQEFNSIDHIATQKHEGTGNGGWNIEKYLYFRENYLN